MVVPLPKPLPGSRNAVLYAMVGDEVFPLKLYLLKLYPSRQLDDLIKTIFNNRLSRARRIVKNVFGIMGERFAFFQKPIALDTGKVEIILLAACALQNVLEPSARTCTCRQAALIRRIWKGTIQSVIGAVALLPRVTASVYKVREETEQV